MEEALRRGFRADKPLQPWMHAANAAARCYCHRRLFPPSFSHSIPARSLFPFAFRLSLSLSLPLSFSLPLFVPLEWPAVAQLSLENANRHRESNGYEIVRDVALFLSLSLSLSLSLF